MFITFEDLSFYKKLFTLIKIKGKEPLIQFLKDLESIKEQEVDKIIIQSLFGKSSINELYERNRYIVSFLMDSDATTLESILKKKTYIYNIVNNINQEEVINSIENIKILKNLGIDKVCLTGSPDYDSWLGLGNLFYVYANGKSIKKSFSDVKITYEEASQDIFTKDETLTKYHCKYGDDYKNFPTWIIITDNKWESSTERHIYLRKFDFDTSKLPSIEELDSYYGGLRKENNINLVYSHSPLASSK